MLTTRIKRESFYRVCKMTLAMRRTKTCLDDFFVVIFAVQICVFSLLIHSIQV